MEKDISRRDFLIGLFPFAKSREVSEEDLRALAVHLDGFLNNIRDKYNVSDEWINFYKRFFRDYFLIIP